MTKIACLDSEKASVSTIDSGRPVKRRLEDRDCPLEKEELWPIEADLKVESQQYSTIQKEVKTLIYR